MTDTGTSKKGKRAARATRSSSSSSSPSVKNPAFYVFGKEQKVIDLGAKKQVVDKLQEAIGGTFTTLPPGRRSPEKLVAYCDDEGLLKQGLARNFVGELLLIEGLSYPETICIMGVMGPIVLVWEGRKGGMSAEVLDILAEMADSIIAADGDIEDEGYAAKMKALRSSLLEKLGEKNADDEGPASKKRRGTLTRDAGDGGGGGDAKKKE